MIIISYKYFLLTNTRNDSNISRTVSRDTVSRFFFSRSSFVDRPGPEIGAPANLLRRTPKLTYPEEVETLPEDGNDVRCRTM